MPNTKLKEKRDGCDKTLNSALPQHLCAGALSYAQSFRPSAHAGKAHCFIHAESKTSLTLGRSLGFQASIQRNRSNKTAFSSSLTKSVPQAGRSPFTHSSNRLSHDQISRSLLSGLPVFSSNHFVRSSHLSHHSDGRRPCR